MDSSSSQQGHSQDITPPYVGLFVTCLVDNLRPSVGFATVQLLEEAGCRVEVPIPQSCCGQPGYNNGLEKESRDIARMNIDQFKQYEFIVLPSASCAGMLKVHYPKLLKDDPHYSDLAKECANKTYELTQFLVDIMNFKLPKRQTHWGQVTFHDACSALREMSVREQPRKLLNQHSNVDLVELNESETCCGFGGTFAVKFDAISNRLAAEKLSNAQATSANLITSTELGCLSHLAGKASRNKTPIAARHIAEILADFDSQPPICKGK